MPEVFVDDWYNGEREKVSEYIGNKRSILVGMPRLRQLRIKESKSIIKNTQFWCKSSILKFTFDLFHLFLWTATTSK